MQQEICHYVFPSWINGGSAHSSAYYHIMQSMWSRYILSLEHYPIITKYGSL